MGDAWVRFRATAADNLRTCNALFPYRRRTLLWRHFIATAQGPSCTALRFSSHAFATPSSAFCLMVPLHPHRTLFTPVVFFSSLAALRVRAHLSLCSFARLCQRSPQEWAPKSCALKVELYKVALPALAHTSIFYSMSPVHPLLTKATQKESHQQLCELVLQMPVKHRKKLPMEMKTIHASTDMMEVAKRTLQL